MDSCAHFKAFSAIEPSCATPHPDSAHPPFCDLLQLLLPLLLLLMHHFATVPDTAVPTITITTPSPLCYGQAHSAHRPLGVPVMSPLGKRAREVIQPLSVQQLLAMLSAPDVAPEAQPSR